MMASMAEMQRKHGDADQRVQTSSCKMSESWIDDVQHGDYT